jgi:GDP-D-mannose 3', 5'-epimerase
LNIGSQEMISINDLARLVAKIANKTIRLVHVDGPLGVRGRTSDNALIFERLGWRPGKPLADGLAVTYAWIADQIAGSA